MPKGPRGEKRPADAIGLAVMIGKIATGEIEDQTDPLLAKAAAKMGSKGGRARALNLSPEQRKAAARLAAQARWKRGK